MYMYDNFIHSQQKKMNLKIIIPPKWNPENFNKWANKIYKYLPVENRLEVLRQV